VTINRRESNWGKVVFEHSNRKGVDVVVDNVGAATFQTSIRSLKRGGRLLTVGNTSGPKFEFDNRYIFGKHLSILGSTMGPHRVYEQVMGLIFEGKLNPVIEAVYPLAEGIEALRKMERGEIAGKLVLHP
jgi:NADPH:quinone reductase-like Zn-dependent oxidoreductase